MLGIQRYDYTDLCIQALDGLSMEVQSLVIDHMDEWYAHGHYDQEGEEIIRSFNDKISDLCKNIIRELRRRGLVVNLKHIKNFMRGIAWRRYEEREENIEENLARLGL